MNETLHEGIAIIGLTGRFPGASDINEFWRNLVGGVESISTFSDEELAAGGINPADVAKIPDYVRARGVLKDADCFDAAFFGMNPKEAEATDPQQRVFLEAAWSALEDAGYVPGNYRGAIGLFAGMTNNTYYLHNLHARRDVTQIVGWLTTMMGNEKDYLATRVAYKLNLKGPALNIYTACSTSLVAVCQAVQQLQNFSCDIALAGGVSITFPQRRGYQFQEGGITSPDGHCRAFDVNAAGTVFSHGLGVVVLKRLDEAVRDGDHIYAVIKGAALNNDGSNKVSFTAPSVDGQAEVIALAQAVAGIEPDTISYIEAHGTGTPLGDPIEVAALTQAFRAKTSQRNFCGLGAVKSNFGHLDAAAGVAGLIKTALALKNRKLPPTLHFTKPNPKLELETSPFFVVDKLTDWKRNGSPLRAGVSSFGVGGTNAHVVLEEAPEIEPSSASRAAQLIVLSAKSAESLEAATSRLCAHFKANPEINLADAAFTLQVGRAAFAHRRMLVCRSTTEAAAVLESRDSKKIFSGKTDVVNPPVVFMFPGQGAQYVNMAREVYESEASFREDVNRCAEILRPHIGLDLRDVLYPAADKIAWAEEQLIQTRITQPALFVIEYALAKLWMSWGIKPAAMIGHSVGEYVAGCLAGVFTLEEGLELVAGRARLVQAQPPGAMLAVRLSEAEVLPLLGEKLSIAAINSPNLCVVSGPHDAVEALERELEAKKIVARRLHTSHAFHSAMMDPVLAPFTELLKKVAFKPPQIPYVSNVTAKWITAEVACDPNYWAGHVRQAVRFADGLGELLKNPQHVLLEVGPGQTLAQLARQHPSRDANQVVLSSLATAKEQGTELNSLLTTLGRLWLAGVQPDWNAFYANERRHRVPLPTYAFEKKRYWVQPGANEIIPWASPPAGQAIGASQLSVPSSEAEVEAVTDETRSSDSKAQEDVELSRKERILKLLTAQLSELSGMDATKLNPTASFLELGFDSLFLTQASLAFQNRYGVKITFRQLLEELPTLSDLAAYLDSKLAAGALPATPPTKDTNRADAANKTTGIKISAPVEAAPVAQKYFGPFKPIDVGPQGGLTERQQKHLDDLVARYTKRTAGSKRVTQEHRARFADPRAAAGFKHLWKEMVYPIVAARSQGAKIWDVDGNEYIDITLGFGLGLLGHKPPFVVEAIEKQLALGMEIGPSSPLAGKVAELMCEFSGQERVTFCNTGSEAVTAALRISRTVSGRNKVAMFTGSYHGIFDEVLVRPQIVNGELRSIPIAPGIAPDMVNNMIALEYGSDEALRILREHGNEIAAVLVEPVQSRRPDFQPREFLHELRRVTEKTGTALIFDETVTGFRCHPGGAQAWFGVKADISTYGKVVGGGLPIGVCCGRAKYMDALDGGHWQYGDDSFPEVGVTFFAGTFVRHPLALAAALAVLTHLKEQGAQLQDGLNRRAEKMCDELNAHFASIGVPIRLARFSSMYYVAAAPELKYSSLLFYHLREKGLHIWEGRPSFLSVAHTDEDIARIVRAFKESVAELQAGGFFPESVETPKATQTPPEIVTVPLTEAQKELWLAAQLGDDASRAFNDTTVIHLRGPTKLELMREAWQTLVDRHDALRTTFSPDGSGQSIVPELQLEIPLLDLSSLDQVEREAKLADAVERLDRTPFDLANGPLIRVEIVKFGAEDHALLFSAHHLIADGWSIGVLLHELSLLYSARAQGLPSPLGSALQYRDYAKWEHSAEHRDEASAAETYWVKQFSDAPAAVDLPADRQRPSQKTYHAARESCLFESDFYQQLKKASAKQGCTLLTYLLASFKAWIHRATGQEDIVAGIPAAGQIARSVSELDGHRALVGHCVNLLPLRSRCDGSASFAAFLSSVRRATLDAYEHQTFTFGTLIEKLKLPRDKSRVPLVSLTFNVDRAFSGFHLHGLETRIVSPVKGFNLFDVGVNVVDFDHELRVDFRYNTDLFDAATVQHWLGQWRRMLEAIVANPNQSIGSLPLMDADERRRVLVEWNQTAVDFKDQRCVHDLFEEQTQRTPDATAVVFEGKSLTFSQLNRRANQIAHQLRKLGAEPETIVGLCVERSLEMVVGLLGILKSGGAYAAMDPALPTSRLEAMIEESMPRVILTNRRYLEDLPKKRPTTICLDDAELANESDANLTSVSGPQNLAYVIFTSGSTGRPKGVAVEHQQLVNYLHGIRVRLDLPADASYATVSTIAADLGNTVLFPPLCFGGTLHVISLECASDPKAFAEYFRRHHIDCLKIVPSHLTALLAGADARQVIPHIRLILGGEALPWALAEQIKKVAPHCRVFNHYGPTETTVGVLTNEVVLTQKANGAPNVPLGCPIPNTQIYILDSRRQPLPQGMAGEIYIGGRNVARGYLNQPALTEERFVPDPFNPAPGNRLYRTGDRARFLADGKIEFLGRIDQQVKIRGYRIELGEIEVALTRHAEIREAVAVASDNGGGEKQLVAYFVGRTPAIPVVEVRRHLKAHLPDYMVPAALVQLEKLPLTTNGKIDRRALPVPDHEHRDRQSKFVAPDTETEKILAQIWSEVLKVPKIGIHDDFFELGGHSLLAAQAAARIRRQFEVDISLSRFLNSPTVAGMAATVEELLIAEVSKLSDEEAQNLMRATK